MSYTKKEREQYNLHRDLVCERLGITKNQYNWFRRQGTYLHQVYENNCNGVYVDEEIYNKISGDLEATIYNKALELDLYIYFQTDPRGATIYLDKKEIPQNNYTSSYCIY